jgi:hypothetical protein
MVMGGGTAHWLGPGRAMQKYSQETRSRHYFLFAGHSHKIVGSGGIRVTTCASCLFSGGVAFQLVVTAIGRL